MMPNTPPVSTASGAGHLQKSTNENPIIPAYAGFGVLDWRHFTVLIFQQGKKYPCSRFADCISTASSKQTAALCERGLPMQIVVLGKGDTCSTPS